MTCGIYCYKDTQNNDEVVYVGKDSHIDVNKRHKAHHQPSKYDAQVINRVLQNNPDRYSYHVLKQGDFNEGLLNALEIIYTVRYNPKFSFTIGGDGTRGYKLSEEHKRKISESLKEKYKNSYNYWYGKTHRKETCKKMSESRNTTGFFRVSKQKNPACKQGFVWNYSYYCENKRKAIVSVNLDKLKQKVLDKGLEWIEF